MPPVLHTMSRKKLQWQCVWNRKNTHFTPTYFWKLFGQGRDKGEIGGINHLRESLNRSPMSPWTQPCPERNGNNMVRIFAHACSLHSLIQNGREPLGSHHSVSIHHVEPCYRDPYLVPGTRGKAARCNCPCLDNFPPFRASTFPPYVNLDASTSF